MRYRKERKGEISRISHVLAANTTSDLDPTMLPFQVGQLLTIDTPGEFGLGEVVPVHYSLVRAARTTTPVATD